MESEFYFRNATASARFELSYSVYSLTDMSDPQVLELNRRDLSSKESAKATKSLTLRSPFAEQVLRSLADIENGLFLPDRLDANDPPWNIFTPNDLSGPSRLLSQPWGYVFFKKSKPFRLEGSIHNRRFPVTWTVENGKQQRTKSLRADPIFTTELLMWISVKSLSIISVEKLERALSNLFDVVKGEYGFLCRTHEHVLKNYVYEQGQGYWFEGNDPEQCLPGVYYANFFGPRYVEWFGKDKLLSAPWQEVKTSSRGVIVAHAGSSLDYYQETQGADVVKRVINHLGAEAFFDRNERERKYKTPFAS